MRLLRLLKTQVIFFNIKGPEILHQDCGSVCVCVRCLGFFLRHLILVSCVSHFHIHPCAMCITRHFFGSIFRALTFGKLNTKSRYFFSSIFEALTLSKLHTKSEHFFGCIFGALLKVGAVTMQLKRCLDFIFNLLKVSAPKM